MLRSSHEDDSAQVFPSGQELPVTAAVHPRERAPVRQISVFSGVASRLAASGYVFCDAGSSACEDAGPWIEVSAHAELVALRVVHDDVVERVLRVVGSRAALHARTQPDKLGHLRLDDLDPPP